MADRFRIVAGPVGDGQGKEKYKGNRADFKGSAGIQRAAAQANVPLSIPAAGDSPDPAAPRPFPFGDHEKLPTEANFPQIYDM